MERRSVSQNARTHRRTSEHEPYGFWPMSIFICLLVLLFQHSTQWRWWLDWDRDWYWIGNVDHTQINGKSKISLMFSFSFSCEIDATRVCSVSSCEKALIDLFCNFNYQLQFVHMDLAVLTDFWLFISTERRFLVCWTFRWFLAGSVLTNNKSLLSRRPQSNKWIKLPIDLWRNSWFVLMVIGIFFTIFDKLFDMLHIPAYFPLLNRFAYNKK